MDSAASKQIFLYYDATEHDSPGDVAQALDSDEAGHFAEAGPSSYDASHVKVEIVYGPGGPSHDGNDTSHQAPTTELGNPASRTKKDPNRPKGPKRPGGPAPPSGPSQPRGPRAPTGPNPPPAGPNGPNGPLYGQVESEGHGQVWHIVHGQFESQDHTQDDSQDQSQAPPQWATDNWHAQSRSLYDNEPIPESHGEDNLQSSGVDRQAFDGNMGYADDTGYIGHSEDMYGVEYRDSKKKKIHRQKERRKAFGAYS